MASNDIRWIQRFENFEKALLYLEQALQIKNPDIIQKAGIIQFFEMSYELAWNTLKDFFENEGFIDLKFPRPVLKKAFEAGIITDGEGWMELLLDRNLTAHTYDEEKATAVEQLIHNKYYPILKQLYESLKQKR